MNITGDGLDILIQTQYTPMHDWMSFAACYSISKNLPDANVILACERGLPGHDLYAWARRGFAKFFQHSSDNCSTTIAEGRQYFTGSERLVFPAPNVIAVREYDEMDVGPIPAASNGRATFVDYGSGVGKFVEAEWIDKIESPFENAVDRFGTHNLSVNEVSVLKVWEKAKLLFSMVKEG